ncbi:MAG TPA: hypothetical protein IAB38_02845 [Candidatus Onthousia excrementipullorum]|uniref:Uncharacterized protein n=1 Tax=Candidatus Onthousia excrementipullorum TaxID=2840884 RepID=A0A9D1DTT1_9FIRM|nr:hypothetical protein [Candidatus Onthousia excrementipullorum]
MDKHVRIITVTALSLLGILCIASGVMYSSLQANNVEEKVLVVVEQKQVSKENDIDIKLKNLTIEVNTPLSVKIIDYLDSAVSDEVLANLKLDTSEVNVTEPGTYNYTVTYKKKTYQGIIIVKEKEVTNNTLQSITLKTVNINVGTALPTDVSNYVIEPLTDDIKATMLIDLSKVNVNTAGNYQYTITYNNSIYTGTIVVTETQPTLSTNIGEEPTPTPNPNPNPTPTPTPEETPEQTN